MRNFTLTPDKRPEWLDDYAPGVITGAGVMHLISPGQYMPTLCGSHGYRLRSFIDGSSYRVCGKCWSAAIAKAAGGAS